MNIDAITIRPHKAGEASYVSFLQMNFYARTYGFKPAFEYYLLTAMAEFIASPAGSQIWVALDGEKLVGSIAIVRTEPHTAQLRWFMTDAAYQGYGIGRKLMETALRFCEEQGYAHVFLWTLESLTGARHLYEAYGFAPTEQKPNTEWSTERLIEERWELTL